MKSTKRLVVLLTIVLLIPITVLAATCKHEKWITSNDKITYSCVDTHAHKKTVQHMEECFDCGKPRKTGTAKDYIQSHSKVEAGIKDKRICNVTDLYHVFQYQQVYRCKQCGYSGYPYEIKRVSQPHRYVYVGSQQTSAFVSVDVYRCRDCGHRKPY